MASKCGPPDRHYKIKSHQRGLCPHEKAAFLRRPTQQTNKQTKKRTKAGTLPSDTPPGVSLTETPGRTEGLH